MLATGGYANDHSSDSLLAEHTPHLKDLPTTNGPWAEGEVFVRVGAGAHLPCLREHLGRLVCVLILVLNVGLSDMIWSDIAHRRFLGTGGPDVSGQKPPTSTPTHPPTPTHTHPHTQGSPVNSTGLSIGLAIERSSDQSPDWACLEASGGGRTSRPSFLGKSPN